MRPICFIRGKLGVEFDKDIAYHIRRAYAQYCDET